MLNDMAYAYHLRRYRNEIKLANLGTKEISNSSPPHAGPTSPTSFALEQSQTSLPPSKT